MDQIAHVKNAFKDKASLYEQDGISFVGVKDASSGLELMREILPGIVDSETLLFISGGKTPESLYRAIAQNGGVEPGAVALVDERYGMVTNGVLPNDSNQKMLADCGFLDYLKTHKIPFYGVLQEGLSMFQTEENYEKVLSDLFKKYSKIVALLGIGNDAHTSGIKPGIVLPPNKLSFSYHDPTGPYDRVTTTFNAMSKMGVLIPLVFGESKWAALGKMLTPGTVEEAPDRFFAKPEIAVRTVVVTDKK